MIDGGKVLAIIPARGGSKRLPGKNTKLINGKPLICWSVEAALKSKFIDQIVVTSESDDILSEVKTYNIIKHRRPERLALDTTTSIDVAVDVLATFSDFSVVIWLQPTSPLRTARNIDEALQLHAEKKAASIVSVTKVAHSPMLVNELDSERKLSNFPLGDIASKRAQDLRTFHQINGAIYVNTTSFLLENYAFFSKDTVAYEMGFAESVDIDTIYDFELAKVIFRLHPND